MTKEKTFEELHDSNRHPCREDHIWSSLMTQKIFGNRFYMVGIWKLSKEIIYGNARKALPFSGNLWYIKYKVYHPLVQRGTWFLTGGLSGFYCAY